MNWKEHLQSVFGQNIIDAKVLFENNSQTLEVVANVEDSNELEKVTEQINTYWDQHPELFEKIDYLSVLSKGYDPIIQWNELKNHVNKDILIRTHKSYLSMNEFNGILIECDEQSLTLKWNNKGQIKKTIFNKDNITQIEEYFKF